MALDSEVEVRNASGPSGVEVRIRVPQNAVGSEQNLFGRIHGILKLQTQKILDLNEKAVVSAKLEDRIMSAISDFAGKLDVAITRLETDVVALKAKVAALQGTVGVITLEEQKMLDAIAKRLESLDATTPQPPAP